jgi:hypothetical protein
MAHSVLHMMRLFASLAIISVLVSGGSAYAQGHLKICVHAPSNSAPSRAILPVHWHITDRSAKRILEGTLRVPKGKSRCTEIHYDQLIRAGLKPDAKTNTIPIRIVIVGTDSSGREKNVVRHYELLDSIPMHYVKINL